jgi:Sulfotransferase family
MARQQVRHRLLSDVCSGLSAGQRGSTPPWSEFFVDDERKYIYCKVEKVACTTWKRTLLDLTGEVNNAVKLDFYKVHSRFTTRYIRKLSSYKQSEIEHRLKTYFKFMFTRHPFERLVSAYRSKIKRDEAYKSLRKRISERRRKGVRFVRLDPQI